MAEGAALLLVEAPGETRDAWAKAATERGATVYTRDDAMQALAELSELRPQFVLVGADPGPPGSMSLCRILERKLEGATIYRLGDPGERAVLSTGARCLSVALSANELVERIFPPKETGEPAQHSGIAVDALQFIQVLLRAADHSYSGRLWVSGAQGDYEILFVEGVPVASHSDVGAERLGGLAVELALLSTTALAEALDLSRRAGIRLGQAMVELGHLDGSQLHRLLSEQHVRRLIALCAGGPVSLRMAPTCDDEVRRQVLLRVSPLTVLARALRAIPQSERDSVLQPVLGRPLTPGPSQPETDRFLGVLGISDLGSALSHPKTLSTLKGVLESALDEEQDLSPDDVLLLLLWCGRIRVASEGEGLHELPTGPLSAVLSQNEFPAPSAMRNSAVLSLPTPVRDYLLGAGNAERPRSERVLSGPEQEATAGAAEFLTRYHRDKLCSSPLGLLGIESGLDHFEVRRAYLAALEAIDNVPEGSDGLAMRSRRAELRMLYDHAFARLGAPPSSAESSDAAVTTVDEGAGETTQVAEAPAAVAEVVQSIPAPERGDLATLTEVELLVQQTRWADLLQTLEATGTPLSALPADKRLLYAVARREVPMEEGEQPHSPKSPERIAIEALASLLGVSPSSAIPLVLAKRLLRRRPIEWNRPASGRFSILTAIFALIVGASIGLVLQHAGVLDNVMAALSSK